MLAGEKNAFRDIVLLNSARGAHGRGQGEGLEGGRRAHGRQSIDSGKARWKRLVELCGTR